MNLVDGLKTELPNWRISPRGDYVTADNGQHRVYFTGDDGHITARVCVTRDVFVSGAGRSASDALDRLRVELARKERDMRASRSDDDYDVAIGCQRALGSLGGGK